MKAVIFDFNGTLFWDTEKNFQSWHEYSKAIRGYPLTDEETVKLNGRSNRVTLEYLKGRPITDQEFDDLSEGKETIYRKLCKDDKDNFHLAPGVIDVLNFLKEKCIPIGIASMAGKGNMDFYIENFNLLNWFDRNNIVYDDGKMPGKPDPTIYLEAAKRIGVDPKDIVVVEDSGHGIEAAKNAGMGMIISLGKEKELDELKAKYGVAYNISDFTEFKRDVFSI
ncbi:hAD-superfamily hydrolase subfamily IA variant 3 [Tritrichomonas foetus]|uniref:HAD-superfamily hydrolase subfamily IA variant 3 n=1 Tax=Tritrichomonas foetus TaxID=1144522 RepID=A0A1J4KM54_9EUKA|nr:hAD-superfamily hydrolase subfamily IA variant 3 [Tritrichomonas foetus]|eukprot:OHT10453.1 hAD-superfamily hydrolase subfamily IA variant 3 [Tritrichomonas foetus]